MKALVFHNSRLRQAAATIAGQFYSGSYVSSFAPTRLQTIPDPKLRDENWVVLDSRRCGICGSDSKQVFLDGRPDNPLTAIISFPHVLGHELVGVVREAGSQAQISLGTRVALYCSLACAVRGIQPPCRMCAAGHPPLCENLTEPPLSPTIHIGNSRDVSGGFAEKVAAHRSQLFPIPDGVTDEQAMLCDPVGVALHPIVRFPPNPDRPVLVYGMGTIGLCLVAAMRKMYPQCEVWAVARYPYQVEAAKRLGAHAVLPSRPRDLIQAIAEREHGPVRRPWYGLPWLERGAGTIYDTITSAETVETSLRIADKRSTIVHIGVSTPKRFEWTLLYFKELEVKGSNAFGWLTWQGERLHCYELYWKLIQDGMDLSSLITHRFTLDDWAQAMLHAHHRSRYQTIKAAFRFD